MKAPKWLVQDAPEDPILGGEYDPPSHDGGVLVSALVIAAVMLVLSSACLSAIIMA